MYTVASLRDAVRVGRRPYLFTTDDRKLYIFGMELNAVKITFFDKLPWVEFAARMSKVQHRYNLIYPPDKPPLGQTLSKWNTYLH